MNTLMNTLLESLKNSFLHHKLNKAIRDIKKSSFRDSIDIMDKCLMDVFLNYNYITDENNFIRFEEVTLPKSFNRTHENHTDGCCLIDNPMEIRFFFDNGNENIYDSFSHDEHDILIKIMENILKTVK